MGKILDGVGTILDGVGKILAFFLSALTSHLLSLRLCVCSLERQLSARPYLAGDAYSIADIATFPWYGALVLGLLYGAAEFLAVHEYTSVIRWAEAIAARPAVARGRMVNKAWGDPAEQLPERHAASDFEGKLKDPSPPKG